MKRALLFALLLCAVGTTAAQPRFIALDVIVTSSLPIAAWQFELSDVSQNMKVVGVESGDSDAFVRPPYYDRAAVTTGSSHRIVVASYSLAKPSELPQGHFRIATIHVMVDGADPDFELRLITAVTSAGDQVEAIAELFDKQGNKL